LTIDTPPVAARPPGAPAWPRPRSRRGGGTARSSRCSGLRRRSVEPRLLEGAAVALPGSALAAATRLPLPGSVRTVL